MARLQRKLTLWRTTPKTAVTIHAKPSKITRGWHKSCDRTLPTLLCTATALGYLQLARNTVCAEHNRSQPDMTYYQSSKGALPHVASDPWAHRKSLSLRPPPPSSCGTGDHGSCKPISPIPTSLAQVHRLPSNVRSTDDLSTSVKPRISHRLFHATAPSGCSSCCCCCRHPSRWSLESSYYSHP